MKFIDVAKILLSSGKGGPGSTSFRREKFVPRGGPDGGNGGRGAHVIFRVNKKKTSLLDFRYRSKMAAPNGGPGTSSLMSGADANDLVIEVPQGTQIKTLVGDLIKDLDAPGDFLFLKGGRGGKGNTHFKNSVNQAPDYAQPGEPGEEQEVCLELKLLADIGIVGFPNAGKSTLISRISAARPKIADYPFTTLVPNLGVVDAGEGQSFVIADIPGIIEGASQGIGLGFQFLRHIERTRIFVHLIDISGFSGREPLDDYHALNQELKLYDEADQGDKYLGRLSDRIQLVVLNKIDTLSDERRDAIVASFRALGLNPMLLSAATGQGLKELIQMLKLQLQLTAEIE